MFLGRTLVLTLLCCCTALQVAAQQPTKEPAQPSAQQQDTIPGYRFRILGVYDERTGDPVEGAKISDMASGTSSLTTVTGTVSLVFLPDGGNVVSIKKVGYEPRIMPVVISPDDTLPITLVMHPLAPGSSTRLKTVNTTAEAPYISPGLRGFKEREKEGFGYFIDDTTLRKNEGHLLTDVLRPRTPGAVFFYGPHSTFYMGSDRCPKGAPVLVYLDGVLLGKDPGPTRMLPDGRIRQTTTPPNLSRIQVSDLGAVEWYASTDIAPVEFGGTTGGCGVLLLWTRER